MDDNSMMLPVGTILRERYRIDKYLASGGFGNTYKVHDVHLNEDFVIKEFFCRTINSRKADSHTVTVSNPSNTADFEGLIGKFRKEALRIRTLKGEHIVHVHDLFDENGTAYYVMDFIDGESLNDVLKRRGPLPEAEVLCYLQQMLDALDETHKHSIWHLDIKPGNMMLDRDGKLKLIDFGASKLVDATGAAMTTSLAMAYTPGYAPVEQTEQKIEAIGAYTDLYAVGATLYNLLTGERPPSMTNMIAEGDDAFHYPADVSQSMRQLIRDLMQIHSAKRPQNVAQVRQFISSNNVNTELSASNNDNPDNGDSNNDYPDNGDSNNVTVNKAQASEPPKALVPSATETPKASKKKWLWLVLALAICLIGAGIYHVKKSHIDYTTYNLELVAAAENGDAYAQAALGDCYLFGNGVTIDLRQAFEWYQKSAAQDNPIGIYGLGGCYYAGDGVERDSIKGLNLMKTAGRMLVKMENSNNPLIVRRIGDCYANGHGVDTNEVKAFEYYSKGAEQGDALSQLILGYCYEVGLGVTEDAENAEFWYYKSAKLGNETAKEILKGRGKPWW